MAHLTMQKRFTLALYIEKSMKIALVPLVTQLYSLRRASFFLLSSFDLDKVNLNPPLLYRPIRPQCQGVSVTLEEGE